MDEPAFPLACLPDSSITQVVSLTVAADHHAVILELRTTSESSPCPRCAHPATRIHSRYTRHLTDLPLATMAVRIILQARRFFCGGAACSQRIFTERLPTMLAPYARRTRRLRLHHTRLGFALGGRPGTQIAQQSACPISRHQLLRDVRASARPAMALPTIIGVDDWAMRKGWTYGTIILDLLTHQPLDLLPQRDAETLVQWLQAHPSVTHISRDRAGAYADGCTRGAPQAIQIGVH